MSKEMKRYWRRTWTSPRRRGALAGLLIMGVAMGFAAAAPRDANSALASKTAAELSGSPAPTVMVQH